MKPEVALQKWLSPDSMQNTQVTLEALKLKKLRTPVYLKKTKNSPLIFFRISGFLPIKAEVDNLVVRDLAQTRVSRVFRVE